MCESQHWSSLLSLSFLCHLSVLRGQSLFSLKQIHFMKEQPPPASEVMLPLSVSLTHSVVTILKHMVILADGQIKLDLLSSI